MGLGPTFAMNIVCASSVLFGKEAFDTLGRTISVPEAAMSRNLLEDASALIVRSKTNIDEALLEGTQIQLVGVATAGVDHMDIDYLDSRGIAWCSASGCNANSVAEYVVASLLVLSERRGRPLAGLVLGVIGVGHVGSAVAEKARALGMTVLEHDPPRQAQEPERAWTDLPMLLESADVVTLHVPLVEDGLYRTRGLADAAFFGRLRAGAWFINSCRGEVVEETELLNALDTRHMAAVLDVWDHEPRFQRALLERVELGTPHIAGYSYEGRLNGTLQVYAFACGFFERTSLFQVDRFAPPAPRNPIAINGDGLSDTSILRHAVRVAYDIEEDDRLLREGAVVDDSARGAYFIGLRRNYGMRREFQSHRISGEHLSDLQIRMLEGIGFLVDRGGRVGLETNPGSLSA